MSYASASDVSGLVHNLLGPLGTFLTSTSPTLSDVDGWLTSGCSIINAHLASRGYGPISSTSEAYGMATQANALWAAAMAEDSRLNARVSADERTRGEMFLRQFWKLIDVLTAMDLSRMGVSQVSKAFAGGISYASKQTYEGDTDRIPGRFNRGQFRNSEALTPAGNSSAS